MQNLWKKGQHVLRGLAGYDTLSSQNRQSFDGTGRSETDEDLPGRTEDRGSCYLSKRRKDHGPAQARPERRHPGRGGRRVAAPPFAGHGPDTPDRSDPPEDRPHGRPGADQAPGL